MKKHNLIGLCIGTSAGIIDVVPMMIQHLPWNANLSAFSMWIVVGYILSLTEIRQKGFIKGFIISFLVLLPNLFIIGWNEPIVLIPIVIMTLLLGAF